jgi:hypothetical protein
MAILATAVWEMRASGAVDNGGGYDTGIANAGTDYSLQDAAELALTDLACTTGTSTLTSATGGFTAAMIGNAICIYGGTNFTKGYYFITARADTNTVTLDRTPVGGTNGTVGTGKVGGAISALKTANNSLGATLVEGNAVYIKKGTYTSTISAALTTSAATLAGLSINIVGYNATRTDAPTTTDRPVLQWTGSALTFSAYNFVSNIIFDVTNDGGIAVLGSSGGRFINCKFINSGAATCRATYPQGANFFKCEFICTNGIGIGTTSGANIISCYVHDSVNGILSGTGAVTIIGCVVDTCSSAGVDFSGSTGGPSIVSSVITGCGTGVSVGSNSSRIFNTIVTGCTTGYDAASSSVNYLFGDYNVWNNTSDGANLVKGPHDVTANPLLTNPASGDFTLQAGSPALNVAAMIDTTVGVVGSYKWNIGVDQDSNSSGAPPLGAAY